MREEMKLEVEVISTDTIRPSSPTSANRRCYHLSFLDQIAPPVYNPLVFFYHGTDAQFNNVQKSNQLKPSLSRVLTHYYPLAGRIKDNSFIDCNDAGVPFLTARVSCKLSDLIQNPSPGELNKLLPFEIDDAEELPLGFQFNLFQCGGIGIAVCMSHKVADALSLLTFVRNWAAVARGEEDTVLVEFLPAELFPPRNISGFNPRTGIITEEAIITKRFVFSACKLEEIRTKYADRSRIEGNQRRPSRVEALSAFMWSRFVASTKLEPAPGRFHIVVHTVNLRRRTDPQLPDYCFGNLYALAITTPTIKAGDEDCGNLVSQVRDSISKINREYVKALQETNSHLDFMTEHAESFNRGEMVSLNFTSLCRFPLYEADFGWGKPAWVGSVSFIFKNLVVFMDTAAGDGVEAWINLKEEDMAKFESDKQLLSLANAPN